MNRNVLLMPHSCLYLQKDVQQDVGHSSDLNHKRSGILLTTKDHEENGTESLNWWWSRFGESGHPVFRATSPLSRGTLKSRGGGKLSIHFCADGDTIETVFRTLISVHEFSIYGAVSDVCDECSACQARTGRPELAGQSDPLFEPTRLLMTTSTPSTEVPAQEDWTSWQQLKSDSTSWQRTLKSSHNSQHQRHVVSTLCQEMKNHLTRKVGFGGIPKLDPC